MITEIDGVQYQAQQAQGMCCEGCAASRLDTGDLCDRLPACDMAGISLSKSAALQSISNGYDIIWVKVSP